MLILIESAHYYTFLSSCAEIFGVLVGLIALVYVYKTESIRSNIERTVKAIDDIIKKVPSSTSEMDFHMEVDVNDLGSAFERLNGHLSAADYSALQSAAKTLKIFNQELSSLSRAFKSSAFSAFAILFLSLFGLALPYSSFPILGQVIFVISFILVVVSSLLALGFMRELTADKHSFMVSSAQ